MDSDLSKLAHCQTPVILHSHVHAQSQFDLHNFEFIVPLQFYQDAYMLYPLNISNKMYNK